MGNIKKYLPFSIQTCSKLAIAIMASAVIAGAAGYSIADLFTLPGKSGGSAGGAARTRDFGGFSYGRVIDLGGLSGNYGYAHGINPSRYDGRGSVKEANVGLLAANSNNGLAKNFGAPAGTQGNFGGGNRAPLFNGGNENSSVGLSGPAWAGSLSNASGSSAAAGGATTGNVIPGWSIPIIIYDPGTGEGNEGNDIPISGETPVNDGTGEGNEDNGIPISETPVAATPIPASCLLFGCGLIFLGMLYKKSVKMKLKN